MSAKKIRKAIASAAGKRSTFETGTVVRWVAAGDLTPATKLPGLRGAFLFDPATVNRFRTKRGAA